LKRNKKLPHLIELVSGKKPIYPPIEIKQEKEPEFDIKPINKAFQSVFKILFNKEIKDDLNTYQKYLSKYIILPEKFTSYYGSTVYSVGPPYPPLPSERLVSIKEAEKLSEIPLKIEEIESFDKIKENLSKIGFFVGLFVEGQSMNFSHVYFAINTIHSYKVNDCTNTEYCAYDNMPLNSKYAFGCWRILESEFVLNCHNSVRLKRCFEVDASTNCSDSYFLHNCEGMQDAMFCWNTKGKRYAIGNLQLSFEKYKQIKDRIIEQVADELTRKKELKYDIYRIFQH
jgi:hypothetical protein